MEKSETPEGRILEAIKAGDEAAFLSLYGRMQASLYRFALHMSGSRSTAEDVTQEVFLTLIRRPAGFDPDRGTIEQYLMGVARNCLLRRLRKERGFLSLVGPAGAAHREAEAAGSGPDPLTEVVRDETVRRLREAILALPLHYRETLVLCELEERSYQEAAVILGCSPGTIRSRLHRARDLLVRKVRIEEAEAELARTSSRRCPA